MSSAGCRTDHETSLSCTNNIHFWSLLPGRRSSSQKISDVLWLQWLRSDFISTHWGLSKMPILSNKARKLTRLLATPTCVDVEPRKETSPNWPATGRLQGHTKLTYFRVNLRKFAAFSLRAGGLTRCQKMFNRSIRSKDLGIVHDIADLDGLTARHLEKMGRNGPWSWGLSPLGINSVTCLATVLWANVGSSQGSFRLLLSHTHTKKGQLATNPWSTHEDYQIKKRDCTQCQSQVHTFRNTVIYNLN